MCQLADVSAVGAYAVFIVKQPSRLLLRLSPQGQAQGSQLSDDPGPDIYQSNSVELIEEYTQLFQKAGISNFKFIYTPCADLGIRCGELDGKQFRVVDGSIYALSECIGEIWWYEWDKQGQHRMKASRRITDWEKE
jgi:hypothetical protein